MIIKNKAECYHLALFVLYLQDYNFTKIITMHVFDNLKGKEMLYQRNVSNKKDNIEKKESKQKQNVICKFLKDIFPFLFLILFGAVVVVVFITVCTFLEHNSKLIESIILWILKIGLIIGFLLLYWFIYSDIFKSENNKILRFFMSFGMTILICGILFGILLLLYVCAPSGSSYEPSIKMRPDRF